MKGEDKKKEQKVEAENVEEQTPSKEQEYLEMAQRIKAEFENYKRRNADVVSQSFDNGLATAVEKLLPAIDSFNQAKGSITDESMLKGLDLIYSQIMKAFESIGVKKIEAVGKPFDPKYHNAVLVGNDPEKENDIVLDEYQAGFILKNDKVIRHSTVRINKLS